VRRLEHLARSALRGGKRRREQEREVVEGLLVCMAYLKDRFPPEFAPVLEATRSFLEKDRNYLRGELSPEALLEDLRAIAGGTSGPG
jgi:hypothetical protein